MLSLEEEQGLVDHLRQDCDIKIVFKRSFTPELDIRETLPARNSGAYWWCSLLWDADHSPSPINQYIPTQNHYIIDEFKSEVIHFDRCAIHDKDGNPWIDIGRIAIDHKLWVGNELIERPKHFIALFEKARKWIKKNGVRNLEGPYEGIYVFPSAEKFFKEGGSVGPN